MKRLNNSAATPELGYFIFIRRKIRGWGLCERHRVRSYIFEGCQFRALDTPASMIWYKTNSTAQVNEEIYNEPPFCFRKRYVQKNRLGPHVVYPTAFT